MVITGFITLLLLMFGSHAEAHLTSYPRIAPPTPRDRILIIEPHIDDESIGAAGYAADVHGAGAALPKATAELRAAQVEDVAQDPEQRHVGWHVDSDRFAVDVQHVSHTR